MSGPENLDDKTRQRIIEKKENPKVTLWIIDDSETSTRVIGTNLQFIYHFVSLKHKNKARVALNELKDLVDTGRDLPDFILVVGNLTLDSDDYRRRRNVVSEINSITSGKNVRVMELNNKEEDLNDKKIREIITDIEEIIQEKSNKNS